MDLLECLISTPETDYFCSGHDSPNFSFPEGGERPISPFGVCNSVRIESSRAADQICRKNMKFRPNDEVCIRIPGTEKLEGPYLVSAVEEGRYVLCDANLKPVKDGIPVEEEHLVFYNAFD